MKKPCDCDRCEERDSVAAVLREEIAYQMTKRSSAPVAYAITILKQVLDGIKGGYGEGVSVEK